MKQVRLFKLLPLFSAGLLLASPLTGLADHKVTVYRDHDGDGHYNKKSYSVDGHHYGYGGNYYGYGGHYGRSYGYYGGAYPYYRPYSYYPGPSLSFTYSRPVYSSGNAYHSDNLAVDVQRELRRRGYYRGAIDGDIGPGTRSAIRAYQDDRGLAVTGRIDRSLVRALGVG